METNLRFKVKLFREYCENGGYEKIPFNSILYDMLNVEYLPDGNVDLKTIGASLGSAINTYYATQLMEPYISDQYISEYQTLLQKSIFFNQINIETEKEFDDIFEKYSNSEDILFRGLNEAKYRLYSTLQRNWIGSKLYEKHKSFPEFLNALLENARKEQSNSLKRYLNHTRFDSNNDLAVLSFLQHYGCPTPLLDWTYSFSNALYFATEKIQKPKTKWDIDKYFCVYFIEEKYLNRNSIKEIAETGLANTVSHFKTKFLSDLKKKGFTKKQIKEHFTDEVIQQMFIVSHGKGAITFMTKIERLLTLPILYFSDFKTNYQIPYFINNNMNIINQQGVFIWNSNPTKPLEHIANNESKTINKNGNYRFSSCYNINKNLEKYVKKKIVSVGVTKSYIYPNPKVLVKKAFMKTI